MRRALHAAILAVSLAGATTFAQTGYITTQAGDGLGGFSGDEGPATLARINTPRGIAFDEAGNLYFADSANHRVRRVDAASGVITTVAGTGAPGFNGDGIVATTARLNFPRGLAFDGSGDLFIADSRNHRIRRVAAGTGLISTVAGTGTPGHNGDGIAAASALLNEPAGLLVADDGDLLFTELAGGRVRRVEADTQVIWTVAASLAAPFALASGGASDLYISETGAARVLRRDAATGAVATAAGTGASGYNGDGIPAVSANVTAPSGLAVDAAGHLFIAEMSGQRVRRVDAVTGIITTVAGTGVSGYNGDSQPAVDAQLRTPDPLALDAHGHLFIGEAGGARIRRVFGAGATGNTPPTADAILTFAGPVCGASGGTLVRLSAAASSDPDAGDTLTYTWRGPFSEGSGTVTGVSAIVTLPLGGPHTIALTVSDGRGAEDSTTASIAISDTSSPLLSIAYASVVVPPGTGLYRTVDVLAVTGANAADDCDPSPTLEVNGPELFMRGTTTPVEIVARDAAGNEVAGAVEITVNQGGKPESSGPPAAKKEKRR